MNASIITGMLYAVVAYLFFTCFDSASKFLAKDFSIFQIMTVEFVTATLLLVLLAAADRTRPVRESLKVVFWRLHLARGIAQIIGQSLAFMALPHLSLAMFYVVIFSTPLVVSLLSAITLKEKIAPSHLLGLLAGIVGVLVALRPDRGFDIWVAVAFAGVLSLSASLVILRRMMLTETPICAAVSTSAFLAAGSLLVMPFVYKEMNVNALGLMLLGGALFAMAQHLLTRAYFHAPAGLAAMPQFLQLIFGAIAGYLLFNDVPEIWIYIGGAIVVIANLYVMARQKRLAAIPPA